MILQFIMLLLAFNDSFSYYDNTTIKPHVKIHFNVLSKYYSVRSAETWHTVIALLI